MLARRKKMGSNSVTVKTENRLLRMFRSVAGFQPTLESLGSTEPEEAFGEDQRMIRNAMLESEYMKARAVTAMQRRWDFC